MGEIKTMFSAEVLNFSNIHAVSSLFKQGLKYEIIYILCNSWSKKFICFEAETILAMPLNGLFDFVWLEKAAFAQVRDKVLSSWSNNSR